MRVNPSSPLVDKPKLSKVLSVLMIAITFTLIVLGNKSWGYNGHYIIGHLFINQACDVKVKGRYAFILASDTGLGVVDIKDPEKPKLVGGVHIEGHYQKIILLDNDKQILVTGSEKGLTIVDISNPEKPEIISSLQIHLYGAVTEGNFIFAGTGVTTP